VSKKGVIWIGGQSIRYKASNSPGTKNGGGSKAYALLHEAPLFQWAYETVASLVDDVHLSFNNKDQLTELNDFMETFPDTSFPTRAF